ncbi:hypothetical protein HJFPF1_07753 [Paramyrothecium foliicola]|nr:hypothetical protein HJFPF1_07753 [Paramyrothecium foliicola]
MPSVKNPNGPSKNRLAARASKAKAQRRKRSEEARTKITKAEARRGARPGLLPTSGPGKKLSAKKQRKLEKKMGYAVKRRMEAEGEAEMKGKFGFQKRMRAVDCSSADCFAKMRQMRRVERRLKPTRRPRWTWTFSEGLVYATG